MSKLLAVEHLSIMLKKSQKALVKDIEFSIDSGESLVILGQSGSGKTMTCHAVMGILDTKRFQLEGGILFLGENLLTCGRRERQAIYGGQIAMIPQNPMTAFDPSVRIGRQMMETLLWHTDIKKTEAEVRIEGALKAAGLEDIQRICRSYPYTLSGGMLQRITIAMALMVEAKLIVADEPTTALDVAHRNAIVETFRALREKGTAVLLVTHDFAVAAQMGGELCVMKDGILLERGSVESVLKNPKAAYTRALLEASRLSNSISKAEEAPAC